MLVCTKNWEIVETHHAFYNPEMELHPKAAEINGLDWKRDLADKPRFNPRDLIPFLTSGLPVVAYNAHFDRRMLEAEFRRARVPFPKCEWIDACKTARETLPGLDNHRLATVAGYYDLDTEDMHKADKDVLVLIDICRHLYRDQFEEVENKTGLMEFDPSHLEPFFVRLRQYIELSRSLSIETTGDAIKVDNVVNTYQALRNSLEKRRKEIVEEPTRLARKVNAEFKKIRDQIDQEKDRLDGIYCAYLDQDAFGQGSEITIKTEYGSAKRERVWRPADDGLDYSKIPSKFLKLNDSAIKAEIKAQLAAGNDKPAIPGIPMVNEWKVSRRVK
tara:strand:+ start:137 stop:1129 length:993 start_codon:yes stop_codon:yes gene_type:complete